MKKISSILLVSYCLSIVVLTAGCAKVKEATRGFLGISTNELEKSRKNAITKTFNLDYSTCYNKAKETLKHIGAYIYTVNPSKKLIAVYVSSEDTTPVGIFFKEIDFANTQIEISSPSSAAKEQIAKGVFAGFEDKKDEKKGQKGSDEKK